MFELILHNVSKHITLTEEEQQYFISILQPKKLRRKQYLVQAGDLCRYECFINKGCLRQYYLDEKGNEHVLYFAIEDYWISDMFGLVTGEPALTNIEAQEDCELLLIERKAYEQLFIKIPKMERFFKIILQRSLVSQQRRMIENMSLQADERYRRFAERHPVLEQRLPQKQIASYLGITPESLSRIRKQRLSALKKT
jgi:CRP-like cAMP-binding protein